MAIKGFVVGQRIRSTKHNFEGEVEYVGTDIIKIKLDPQYHSKVTLTPGYWTILNDTSNVNRVLGDYEEINGQVYANTVVGSCSSSPVVDSQPAKKEPIDWFAINKEAAGGR